MELRIGINNRWKSITKDRIRSNFIDDFFVHSPRRNLISISRISRRKSNVKTTIKEKGGQVIDLSPLLLIQIGSEVCRQRKPKGCLW